MTHGTTRTSVPLMALVAVAMLTACSPRPDTSQPAQSASETSPVSSEEAVKTFAIGDLSGMALRDGSLDFPNDNQIVAVGRTPAEVAALLADAGLPTDKLSLTIQPLLVKTAERVLLFDTGAGTNMGASNGRLPASLAAAGIDPASVTDIFLSHVHGDHSGGLLNADGAAAYPNATIHLSAPEWAFLKGLTTETAANVGIAQHAALVAAVTAKVAEFAPGADIIPGAVRAVEIRGHTPGHSGYLITSGDSSLLYIGDTMHHFVVSVQKPDWTIDFDTDAPTAEASRADLLAQSAATGQRIYAVHFPFPGLGKIEQRGEGFVWVAE